MIQQITPLPTPPQPSDSPTEFDQKAFALLGGLPQFVTETNTLGGQIFTIGESATQSAASASASADSAATGASNAAILAQQAADSASSANLSASSANTSAINALASANAAAASAGSVDTAYLLDRANHTGTQPLNTITGTGTAASKNVQTSKYADSGILEVGAFGLGARGEDAGSVSTNINELKTSFKVYNNSTVGAPDQSSGTIMSVGFPSGNNGTQILMSLAGKMFFRAGDYASALLREVFHTGNISSFVQSLFTKANSAEFRTGIGIETGTTSGKYALADSLIGFLQSWQSVTGSRSVGVTYTNTTGRPIVVSVQRAAIFNAAPMTLVVSGQQVDLTGVQVGSYTQYECVSGIVPHGATYVVNSDSAISNWVELR